MVNEDNGDEDIDHALEDIDLVREALVELVDGDVVDYSKNYSLLSFNE